jgi:hypothetical protein
MRCQCSHLVPWSNDSCDSVLNKLLPYNDIGCLWLILHFSRHLAHLQLFANSSLKRCPFRWQCPVSSPTTHHGWSLVKFNSFLLLLAEGPCMSIFVGLSPLKEFHCFLWSVINQSLTAFLVTPTEMLQVLWMDVHKQARKQRRTGTHEKQRDERAWLEGNSNLLRNKY